MTTYQNNTADENMIREMIDKWSRALEAKDLDGLTADYVQDAILFDAIPPYKTVGVENIRNVWANCLPHFPESFRSEHRDLEIHVEGNTAFMYGLHHFIPDDPQHPCGMTWMRITVAYRKIEGKWKVIHEHASIPFNPLNNTAWTIDDPDKLDAPDWSQPEA
ncbi:hypothetical protein Pla110_03110 [Polystyrenella longa]|uniref:SnoaL-like domain-containing protein n=1 Tax=Polystyrenella longa TaxID=2528007 RepID=A0A518CHA4_9PLAN|nr:nuclear transport factor 2 family protein [Polystyrenella longa]QDU78607.1 hypothetical protein Pla110_03110 [Polystyrenella longa]